MSVYKSRKKGHERWIVDVEIRRADGQTIRARRVSPIQTRRGAEQYEREVRQAILDGSWGAPKSEPGPTLDRWVEIFVREHSEAKGLRPSTIKEQWGAYSGYLIPILGAATRIDTIGTPHFHRVRQAMHARGLGAKSMNNALGVLSRSLQFYFERQGLAVPNFDACMVKVPKLPPKFWEPEHYQALVEAAAQAGPRELAVLLLMGDCGLRTGEVIGLEWSHVRWEPAPVIIVQRAYAAGQFGPPKGARPRTVPMTTRTAAALRALPRTLRLPWVITRDSKWGSGHATRGSLTWLVHQAERIVQPDSDPGEVQLHKLRHTYVTRLAAAGVSPRNIMELAGHRDLATSLRYMHVLAGASAAAVSALESFDRDSAAVLRQHGGSTEGPQTKTGA
jgi:integrase